VTYSTKKPDARQATTSDWLRERFGASSFAETGYPGGELIDTGLADLADGRVTIGSLLVSLAAPRLRREGVPVGHPLENPEDRLYALLSSSSGDLAHSRYNAYLRQVVSFADACRFVRLRRKETKSKRDSRGE
jgi:hypothetical protein